MHPQTYSLHCWQMVYWCILRSTWGFSKRTQGYYWGAGIMMFWPSSARSRRGGGRGGAGARCDGEDAKWADWGLWGSKQQSGICSGRCPHWCIVVLWFFFLYKRLRWTDGSLACSWLVIFWKYFRYVHMYLCAFSICTIPLSHVHVHMYACEHMRLYVYVIWSPMLTIWSACT